MTSAPRFTRAEADWQNAERRRRNVRREPVAFDHSARPVMHLTFAMWAQGVVCALALWGILAAFAAVAG